jgi:hypothetical protein
VFRIERGVEQVANLWREEDGTSEDFELFCKNYFISDSEALNVLFNTLERNFEIILGNLNNIDVGLKQPLQLVGPEITDIDMLFGGYSVYSHLTDDFYKNKIAFITALNFPYYSLEEKTKQGADWSRKEWAYARMGDMYISRVPADVEQEISSTLTEADAYISDYNICMDMLRNDKGEQLFPDGMNLISHWGLRDELKSDYADKDRGLEKQRMIYEVMKRIVDQSVPVEVINSNEYEWNPYTNAVTKEGNVINYVPEGDKRYEVFLRNFNAARKRDKYSFYHSTEIDRAFDATMEIPKQDIVELFEGLLSSPQVGVVASLIESRLGRKLEPFDIWYNGFRSGDGISEDELTKITSQKYYNADALKADLPNILTKMGWTPKKAKEISDLVVVESSRGAGHAWGAAMKNQDSRLRTRIGESGMDYKGYNIAVHEFGHNVEQTITMNDVDYFMLSGVPNTAFTEAVAFLFQKRDLELLGLTNPNPLDEHLEALSTFWNAYEIMGVSLVDIRVWEWLYDNPNATPSELKKTVISIAKEIWNKYYADVLGGRDETLLGIYSHMIDYPLYLPNYPLGHLIDFQIGQYVKDKNIAEEIERMYTVGRVIPQLWMMNAVGSTISIEPLLDAVDVALEHIN